ncbi:MAG: methyltransferase domain-containing protein [Oscillospiraceae bacterium]|nr:methyltransferase domain-containing protein [Oscillospiraceae bacterium]
MSFFRCPLCAGPLAEGARSLRCRNGHSFDTAKEGYTNLLPVNQKHAKLPGDDKGMVAARRAFLEKGWYAPLREALCALAVEAAGPAPAVLDAGCGEGYYTAGVRDALLAAGKTPLMAGIDVSKFSLQKAAKKYPGIQFAVASAYRLPAAEESVDLLLNVFSPLAIDEFRRVLRPGGTYLYVVPAAYHLWELKQVLYDDPYLNEEKETPYEGFAYEQIVPVSYSIHLPVREDILALFQMTPYYWKTSQAGAARLEKLEELDCRVDFRVHVFRREDAGPAGSKEW